MLMGGSIQSGCSASRDESRYEVLAAEIRKAPAAASNARQPLLAELVRYATLAANSHNSQPWRFAVTANEITIAADFARRCPAVDPDDHHLFASLGCATENLVVSASALGFKTNVSLDEIDSGLIRIDLQRSTPRSSALFAAIPRRQSTRAVYSGERLSPATISEIEESARQPGVTVRAITAKDELETILEYVVAGNSAQMRDVAFVNELKHWIRFNESVALKHRDGLFSGSSGNPTVPDWFGRAAFGLVFTEKSENDKYRAHIRSSSGVIALSSDRNDRASWVNVGRSSQRLCLKATALGLKQAFINQPVEVPAVREQFASYLGVTTGRPDLLIRFGHGPELPRSLRRPVDQVIVG